MQLFGFLIVANVILNFGGCDTTCAFERVGPNCQFKNIAYSKSSRHDSNIYPPRYSSEANDDNLSTCSYTSDQNTIAPWWNLWLSENTTFKKLEFVTDKRHLNDFSYFEVNVYNTTKDEFEKKQPVKGGVNCYQNDNSIPTSTTIKVTCKGSPVGNLIRVQLQRKEQQLVLCDFRLYGDCFDGFYGNDCKKCSDNCQSSGHRVCNSKNGRCSQGCKSGWKGDRCESECDRGTWGQTCRRNCGNCGDISVCDHITGECPGGCSAGFKPPNCTEVCDKDHYGKNCSYQCRTTCSSSRSGRDPVCNNMNGICLNGCEAGFKGPYCDKECDHGTWGQTCRRNCGNCGDNSVCDHITGECPGGCSAGFKPTKCTEVCDKDHYGKNCSYQCSTTCSNSSTSRWNPVCNNTDGRCLNGCEAGFKGPYCNTKCESGKWGRDCTHKCGKCYNSTCDGITGVCRHGCAPGFKEQRCNTECDSGFYGKNCNDKCSSNCLKSGTNVICDNVNGTCLNGCEAGYKGFNCSTECDNGSYGKDCQNECNSNCLRSGVNAICDNVDGTCLNGCKAGYRGSRCDIKCDDGKWGINCTNECGKCLTSPCNHVNGHCQDGCAAGYKKTWDCHTECDAGTYGKECKSSCSNNCFNVCDKKTGVCSDCKTGWTGERCTIVSDQILSDTEAVTRCHETPKPNIALICVGILCVIVAVYATVITVLFKRKTTQNEKDGTGGSLSGRTHGDANVNEMKKSETVTNEAATEAATGLERVNINAIDDESHQYTDLSHDTKDVETTYETIQLE